MPSTRASISVAHIIAIQARSASISRPTKAGSEVVVLVDVEPQRLGVGQIRGVLFRRQAVDDPCVEVEIAQPPVIGERREAVEHDVETVDEAAGDRGAVARLAADAVENVGEGRRDGIDREAVVAERAEPAPGAGGDHRMGMVEQRQQITLAVGPGQRFGLLRPAEQDTRRGDRGDRAGDADAAPLDVPRPAGDDLLEDRIAVAGDLPAELEVTGGLARDVVLVIVEIGPDPLARRGEVEGDVETGRQVVFGELIRDLLAAGDEAGAAPGDPGAAVGASVDHRPLDDVGGDSGQVAGLPVDEMGPQIDGRAGRRDAEKAVADGIEGREVLGRDVGRHDQITECRDQCLVVGRRPGERGPERLQHLRDRFRHHRPPPLAASCDGRIRPPLRYRRQETWFTGGATGACVEAVRYLPGAHRLVALPAWKAFCRRSGRPTWPASSSGRTGSICWSTPRTSSGSRWRSGRSSRSTRGSSEFAGRCHCRRWRVSSCPSPSPGWCWRCWPGWCCSRPGPTTMPATRSSSSRWRCWCLRSSTRRWSAGCRCIGPRRTASSGSGRPPRWCCGSGCLSVAGSSPVGG